MKIAVNTRLLLAHKLEGIGWFTYEVFKRLSLKHPEVEWLYVFDRPFSDEFIFSDNITPLVVSPPTRHPVLWYIWFEWRLPSLFKQYRPDLFISPDGYLSLKSDIKSLPVIHDINFEHHPDYLPPLAGKYYRHYFPKFARKAQRIATVSEYSRQDIASTYSVDPLKIDLVYNGCGDFFAPLPAEEASDLRQELTGGKTYFSFVGALNPRKNITGMLKAFAQYRHSGGTSKFVIIGDRMFWSREIEGAYEQHPFKEDVIFTGRLEGEALSRVLAASQALLFVSHFEGFGIPIIEAFRCEVPVITSSTTSMPEVAGDAAILCEPDSYQQIADAMHKVGNPSVRNDLIAKAKERANLFTWDRSAEMMWNSIEKTLAE